MTVVTRGQAPDSGPLHALNAVLRSIESVRNGPALYLLLVVFAVSGLLLSMARAALAREAGLAAALWGGAAFFSIFYGSSAAGLVLMDEACGRRPREPGQALRDALATAHRLLLVVLVVVLAAAVLVAACAGLLWLGRLPGLGQTLLGAAVAVVVPVLGLLALVMVTLVGPIAAPAVWFGLGVGAVLRLIVHQVRRRLAPAVMLATAVSLLTAAVAGLVSFVVLVGGRAVLALAVLVLGLDLAPQPFLAALFGQALVAAPGAPALPEHTSAAITGAGVVFALGLVVPGVVYLRGLCELFLALRGLDAEAAALTDAEPGADNAGPGGDALRSTPRPP